MNRAFITDFDWIDAEFIIMIYAERIAGVGTNIYVVGLSLSVN